MSGLTLLLVLGGVILLLIILVQFFRLRAVRYKNQAESYGKILDQQALAHKGRDRLQDSLEALDNELRQEQLNEDKKMDGRESFDNHWSARGVHGESRHGARDDEVAASGTTGFGED